MAALIDMERSGMRLKVFKGDPNEWLSWRAKFEAMVDADGLLDFMLSEAEAIKTGSIVEGDVAWRKKNQKLYCKLVICTEGAPNGVVEQQKESRSGLAAWSALIKKYEVKGNVQKAALLDRLLRDVLSNREDPDVYFIRVEQLQRQLKAMEVDVTDSMMMVIVMSKMSESYAGLRTVLDTVGDLTYDKLKEQMRVYYGRMNSTSQSSPQDSALMTNFKGNCRRCGKYGHREAHCRNSDGFKKEIVCFLCGKRGHIVRNCPNNKEAEEASIITEADMVL